MGLKKFIELENGVTLNYHRITSINKITNISNNIEISSYTSKTQREKEKAYQELQMKSINNEELAEEEKLQLDQGINVFIFTDYINVPYDETMDIKDAYDYIKTLDKYKDATDV